MKLQCFIPRLFLFISLVFSLSHFPWLLWDKTLSHGHAARKSDFFLALTQQQILGSSLHFCHYSLRTHRWNNSNEKRELRVTETGKVDAGRFSQVPDFFSRQISRMITLLIGQITTEIKIITNGWPVYINDIFIHAWPFSCTFSFLDIHRDLLVNSPIDAKKELGKIFQRVCKKTSLPFLNWWPNRENCEF